MDEKRDLLRHTLATLAYRTARALENAPASFADFDNAGRRPVQILSHMGDLLQWALSMAQGNPELAQLSNPRLAAGAAAILRRALRIRRVPCLFQSRSRAH